MKIKIKKLHDDAIIPVYASAGAACFDLYALKDGQGDNATSVYRTGLAFEIPQGHAMLVYSRSGHGFKNDIRLANCVGVIDSDYRGELMIKLTADGYSAPIFGAGERIAQAMVMPVKQVSFTSVIELSDTDRGDGGFGSTGAK